jgi:CAAX prenyl protease-like protein
MFNLAVWARILPFLCYLAFIVLADLLGRLGWQPAELRWLYPVKIALVLLLLVVFWRHYRELAAPRLKPALALVSVLTGVVVLFLWINLDAPWMLLGQSGGYDPRAGGQLLWPLVAVRLAGATLVVPVMEELFWRSFLLRWIEAPAFAQVTPAAVGWKSLLVVTLLFGVEHNLWLAGMVAGAAYSLLYMRSGNLWSAILAHATTNGLLGCWIISTGSWNYW